MENSKKETLEERIEKSGELFKEQMREKAKTLLMLTDEDAISIDLIESFWKESRQMSDKLILDFYNDITNKEIQKKQVSKKKTELICTGYSVRNGGKHEKTILTTQGELKLRRTVLRTKKINEKDSNIIDNKEFIALDEHFELIGLRFKMTKALMDKTAFWAQNEGSYERAQNIMREELGINVSDEYIRSITMYVGGLVHDQDTKQSASIKETMAKIPERPSKEGVLYGMMDGSMLNTLEEFDDKYDWHEVKLGEVFSGNDIKQYKDGKKHYITKKEFTVCTKNIEEFRKYFFELAVRNGYGKYKKMIILGDGAAWISKMRDDFFPDAIQILDFFHLAENIYNSAKFLFSNDAKKYVPWADKIIDLLRTSRTDEALNLLSKYKDVKFGEGALNPYTYVYNNRKKIDYAAYEREGYLIGSGPIEGANKTVVQKRCKQSGMRWKSENLQKMLSLRVKWESKLWKTTVSKLLAAA